MAGKLRDRFAATGLRVIDGDARPERTEEWLNRDIGAEATALRVERADRERRKVQRERERRWHTIYKLYDARDVLLYVGISANGPGRLPQHAATKAWWRKVARAEFEHVKGRSAAEARELELIQTCGPKWNRAGVPRPVNRELRAMNLVSDVLRRASCAHRVATIADRCGLTLEETQRAIEALGARRVHGVGWWVP